MQVTFTVVGPPRGKQRARVFVDKRDGKIRACTPKETAQYENTVKQAAYFQSLVCARDGVLPPGHALSLRDPKPSWPQNARYSLRIVVAFGDNRRRDIDNVLKSVADACNGVLWEDDSQVHHMAVTRVFEGEPRTEVTVEVLP